jgi:hypothetical protein
LKVDDLSAVCCFSRASNWEKVIDASILVGAWMEYLDAAKKISLGSTKSSEMIKVLRMQGRSKEAIEFAKLCGMSSSEVYNLAIELDLYAEAAFIGSSSDELFQGALQAYAQKLLEKITELTTDFRGKSERILRVQKEFANPNKSLVQTSMNGNDDDNVSEMSFRTYNSTIKTRTTNSSRRSGSTNKRTERNRTRDRPGSPHEREFLLFNIRELIGQIYRLAPAVKETLKNLLQFGCVADSALTMPRSIHAAYQKLCVLVKGFIEEDFRKVQVPPIDHFNEDGRPMNSQGSLLENVLIDPLDAKFELPVDFGSPSSWSINLF